MTPFLERFFNFWLISVARLLGGRVLVGAYLTSCRVSEFQCVMLTSDSVSCLIHLMRSLNDSWILAAMLGGVSAHELNRHLSNYFPELRFIDHSASVQSSADLFHGGKSVKFDTNLC